MTSSNGNSVREAGNAPGHRAAGVKAVLPQLTKYLTTCENEGGWKENQIIYSTPDWSTSSSSSHEKTSAHSSPVSFMGTGISPRCKLLFSHYKSLKQLEPWVAGFSGNHPYQMVVQDPSICLTCYFPHTKQPVPIKIKWSLTEYPTSCFSGLNSLAPRTRYQTTPYIQSTILICWLNAVWCLSPCLPSLKINPIEDAVSLVGFISITLYIQISTVW